jgi:peptidoglycan hydrolase-like protein with peptidoglycan-binding domain
MYYGSLTRAAVKRFQESHRAEILEPRGASEGSGYLDLLTRAAINTYKPKTTASAIVTSPPRTIDLPPMGAGSVGTAVRTLQELLAREPDVYPEALVTGYFGPLTKQAVQRFQLKHGVVSSTGDPGYGYVGPKTRAKLAVMYGS